MQDSSLPHSPEEIRRLLGRYLDSLLSLDEQADVEDLLSRFPAYQSELARLKAERFQIWGVLQSPADDLDASDSTLWQAISKHLETDAEAFILDTDPVFISAYYDGETHEEPALCQTFEAQLSHNDEACRVLGEFDLISQGIRRLAARQEETCDVDLASSVMAAFEAEGGYNSGYLAPEQVEMLSAHADNELSPREVIALNHLIEDEPNAKDMLFQFNGLSDAIQSASERWQAQAPDCFEAIRDQLPAIVAENAKSTITPFWQRRQVRQAVRVAGPIAAVTMLFLVSVPILNGSLGFSPFGGPQASSRHSLELASLPLERLGRNSRPLAMGDASMVPAIEDAASSSSSRSLEIPSKPMFEPVNRATSATVITDTPANLAHGKSPSSEEYLFQALNERSAREDVSNILGD
jgi:negative regulator of sigma E activity